MINDLLSCLDSNGSILITCCMPNGNELSIRRKLTFVLEDTFDDSVMIDVSGGASIVIYPDTFVYDDGEDIYESDGMSISLDY